MTLILVLIAFVSGIAFGGWLRGPARDVFWDARLHSRLRYAEAWDALLVARSALIVFGCGLVGHRWREDTYSDQVLLCLRCGKVDWHPARGPNDPTRKGEGIPPFVALPGSGQHPTEPERSANRSHPNLLTEFGWPSDSGDQQ